MDWQYIVINILGEKDVLRTILKMAIIGLLFLLSLRYLVLFVRDLLFYIEIGFKLQMKSDNRDFFIDKAEEKFFFFPSGAVRLFFDFWVAFVSVNALLALVGVRGMIVEFVNNVI